MQAKAIATMLCALLVVCLPRIGSQNPIFRGAVVLLALANGCVGLLLHFMWLGPCHLRGVEGGLRKVSSTRW